MNKTHFIYLFVSLTAIAVVGSGCHQTPQTDPKESQSQPQDSGELPVLVTLPPFALSDQTGERFDSDRLTGKIWIANFIFTRCRATCPVQTANLVTLQKKLEKLSAGADVELISITVDPDYDTPEVLAAYAEQAGVDTGHWHFLTGPREEIWELCKTGFKLAVADAPPDANTLILHSDRFILIDRRGRVRGFFAGTTAEGLAAVHKSVEQLLQADGEP